VSHGTNAYRTVVVSTDGSESSLWAVVGAGPIAGASGAGSHPADATRRSTCDVLVVHTTG
jgi:nucleotide-binding universal stress UspA family protein